jgi:8-oxo-dGTP pyrophosphatase MutT (NUDIX family)
VALVLRDGGRGAELLLVERAVRVGDRWSGHLAFPGGVRARGDSDLAVTAIRETREEAGLDLRADARLLGSLSDVATLAHGELRTMLVSPFVFLLAAEREPELGAELRASFWLVLPELVAQRRALRRPRRMLGWVFAPAGHPLGPARLWGLSLRIADELADVVSR